MRVLAFFTLLVVSLGGCHDSITPPTAPPPNSRYAITLDSIAITDEQILELVYSTFKVPEGFYHEDLQGGSLYYENTLSVLPLSQRTDQARELSTDSHDQALSWSDSSSANSSSPRALQSERETGKYFEFRRAVSMDSKNFLLSRVHKLSYIDRSVFDSFHPGPLVAILKARPIDALNVQTLVQYLWFVQNYQMGGFDALGTAAVEFSDTVKCSLFHLEVTYGDYGVQDEISLLRSLYSVDKMTGECYLAKSTLRVLGGHYHKVSWP